MMIAVQASCTARYFLGATLLFFTLSAYGQGKVDGFYKGKGTIEVGIGGGLQFDKVYFAGTTKINLTRNIRTAALFIGTGITDKFDLYLNIPVVSIGDVKSVQDGSVFLKYQLAQTKLKGGDLTFHLASGFLGNLTNYSTSGVNAIGQQAKIIDIRPVIHYQIYGWFATLQYAYNYKFDPVPSAYSGSIKVGYAAAKYYVDLWYENQYTPGGFDYLGTPAPPSFRELGVNYDRIGGTIYVPIGKRFGIYSNVGYTLSGRNIGQGLYAGAGCVLKNLCY